MRNVYTDESYEFNSYELIANSYYNYLGSIFIIIYARMIFDSSKVKNTPR